MDVGAEWTDSLAGRDWEGDWAGGLEPPGVQRARRGRRDWPGLCDPRGAVATRVLVWAGARLSALPSPLRAVGWTWARVAQVSATRWYVLGFEPRAQGPGDRHTQNTSPLGMGVLLLCDRGLRPGWSTRGCFSPYSLRIPVLAPLKRSPQEVCDTQHELRGQWPVRGAHRSE